MPACHGLGKSSKLIRKSIWSSYRYFTLRVRLENEFCHDSLSIVDNHAISLRYERIAYEIIHPSLQFRERQRQTPFTVLSFFYILSIQTKDQYSPKSHR